MYLSKRVRLEASLGFQTVSLLIFVDWLPQFIAASCPHCLGTDMGAARGRACP
jgi:hypothetical protein